MDTRDVIRWEYLPSPGLLPGVLRSELGEAVFGRGQPEGQAPR